MQGGVLRLEGFFPMPFEKINYLYLFGTSQMKLSKTNFSDPLILRRVDGLALPRPDTVIVTLPPVNRDYYRIGFGVDFISLFTKIFGERPAN